MNIPEPAGTYTVGRRKALQTDGDCISRQCALDEIIAKLDAIDHVPQWVFDELTGVIGELPSVQPEERTEERTETHACDFISRQQAVALAKDLQCPFDGYEQYNQAVNNYCAELLKLPSAQSNTDRIYAELSKAYNVEGLPDEAIGIIGDLMVSLDVPPTQTEIIYCKDCVKRNKARGYFYDGTLIGIKDCCPLVEIRGKAQGHEFDYQFCAYAERRTDEGD